MNRPDAQMDRGEMDFVDDRPNITEMEVTGPTLTWLEVEEPQQPVPIGENDRVLDSRYNEEYDVWEVLLVALPDDDVKTNGERDAETETAGDVEGDAESDVESEEVTVEEEEEEEEEVAVEEEDEDAS